MSNEYVCKCPKCKVTDIGMSEMGNNGYAGICEKCQVLFYYCSIFGKMSVFTVTHESYDMPWSEMKMVPKIE